MMPEPTLNSYLMLSAVLFAIGTAGVFLRRNLITILLTIEIMLPVKAIHDQKEVASLQKN